MAEQTIISAVSPQDFQEQSYNTQDKELLGSAELDTVFSSSTDYIEYNIYDLNQFNIPTNLICSIYKLLSSRR